ncbi:hypothetical protein CE91St28_00020 [Pyramidobacter piscolens]|nr:hypothetical protein CE91St28_00020 [Pyramidobacter piscolens]
MDNRFGSPKSQKNVYIVDKFPQLIRKKFHSATSDFSNEFLVYPQHSRDLLRLLRFL